MEALHHILIPPSYERLPLRGKRRPLYSPLKYDTKFDLKLLLPLHMT